MPNGVDSEIRTHENLGCSQAPSTARPCPRIDKLAEGTGTDPEACRLQALSRRCPSPMGLPSLFGGERRSRSPDLRGRIAFEAGGDPVRFTLRKMTEDGVLETQSLARPICVQSSLGPCPIHPFLCGAPGRFRSGCLLPDKQALSRVSYEGMKVGSGRPNRTAVGDGI